MKRKQLITLLKLLVGLALIVFVLNQVHLRDQLVIQTRGADGKVRSEAKHDGQLASAIGADPIVFDQDPPADAPAGTSPKRITVWAKDTTDAVSYQANPGMFKLVHDMRMGWFVVAALMYFIACSTSAFRWQWLVNANGLRLSMWDGFRLTWIGTFFNNVVPGLTGGDLIKAIYVVRHTGEKTRSIVSVIVDRVMGLLALGLLAALVVPFQMDRVLRDPGFRFLALGIYGTILAVCCLAAVFFSKRIRRALSLDALLKKLPMADLLQKIDDAIRFYRGHTRGLLVWLVFSVINHAISVFSVICVGEALQIGVPWTEYLILIPVINIASAAPIAPAGWGVGEALYGFMFKNFCAQYLPTAAGAGAIMATRGVTLSIVSRLLQLLWSLLGGLFVAFSKEKVTASDKEIDDALHGQ